MTWDMKKFDLFIRSLILTFGVGMSVFFDKLSGQLKFIRTQDE